MARLPATFRECASYIRIDPSAVIERGAAIKIFNPPTPARICLEIGPRCRIAASFALLHQEATIIIGADCLLDGAHLNARDRITLGDGVIIHQGTTLMDTDAHSLYWEERKDDVERCLSAWRDTGGQDISRHHDWSVIASSPIRVGSGARIGTNAIILKGVEIGTGSIVAPGAVVAKDVPDHHHAANNPCVITQLKASPCSPSAM
jgi:acetyltransferase-like isoleucine patch superfamily enzyme